MSKMPECYFYARFGNIKFVKTVIEYFFNYLFIIGRCDNKDCQYQHIDPADKIKDCPWYDRGFCRHGKIRIYFFFLGQIPIL